MIALEDSEVCAIPFSRFEEMSREMPGLQKQFHRIMSREIVGEQGVMVLLGSMRAEERVATFLLNLSRRFRARGYSPTEFHLRMTREEIGSYLGLKLETVSRVMSRFHERRTHPDQTETRSDPRSPGLEGNRLRRNRWPVSAPTPA